MDHGDRPQRIEVTVPAHTVLLFLGLCLLVALVLPSLGSLLSILLASVIARGLDPVVGAMVSRGWKRGRAALLVVPAVFVLVLVTAGAVWREIVEFVKALPGYWEKSSPSRRSRTG